MKKCMHELLVERNQLEFQNKLQTEMKKHNIDTLFLLRPENIFYATGYRVLTSYAPGMPTGVSIAVVPSEGNIKLLVNSLEKEAAMTQTSEFVDTEIFPSWVFIDDGTEQEEVPESIDPFGAIKLALSHSKGTIGLEKKSLTSSLASFLDKEIGNENIIDATSAIMNCRIVKTNWEIKMLKHAANHSEKVMKTVMKEVKEGMTCAEIENLLKYYGAKYDDLNSSIADIFVNTYGPYYYNSGLPRGYKVKNGDLIKFDGGFVHLGYYSDFARTFVVGNEVGEFEQKVFESLYKANELGVSMLKPGVKMNDIYNAVRASVESDGVIPQYKRGHVGHSIGVSPMLEEYPQIAPNIECELKENMVISLETPYACDGREGKHFGMNLEDTFVITKDGYERLTNMPDSLIVSY